MKEQLDVKKNKDKFAIFHIEGGIGKNILGGAVLAEMSKQEELQDYKIIVVTAWPDAWILNPNVFRVYQLGNTPYFYEQYVHQDTKIFRIDPYHTEDHILQRKHLIRTWCDLFSIPYTGESPKLYLNIKEIEEVKEKLGNDNRPILVIQTNGGAPTNNQQNNYRKSWFRDMPLSIAQIVADEYLKAGYRIIQIRREDQPQLNNVEFATLPFRQLFALLSLSSKSLLIDSFAQHATKALGKKSVVCWIGNSDKVYGYDTHINIKSKKEIQHKFLGNVYLEQDITGNPINYPFDSDEEIFDIDEIFGALNQI